MPRFQLLVREPGKEPRIVPLNDPIVVGRSRSVDLTVEDEEVGRKQFRIGVNQGFVVLDSLGATNPTRVDSRVIKAGESTTLDVGETITIGKSEFVVQSADATVQGNPAPPEVLGATMVAGGPVPRPGAPVPPTPVPPTPAPPPPAPPAAPMNTMEFRPPGIGGGGPGVPPVGGETSANAGPKPPRPGSPGTPPAPAAGSPDTAGPGMSDFGQTMAKGFRPGAVQPAGTPPAAPPPATAPPTPKPPTPKPPTPKAPAPKPPTPKPPVAAPQPPAAPPPVAQPAPPAAAPPVAAPAPSSPARPKTVAVRPADMVPPPGAAAPVGTDLESLLHQSSPRLFVKGEGLKRPVRLMKPSNKVGRAETADVLLPHESVSENHAEVCFDGKHWSLVDQGSTNGTIVDGAHLRSTSQVLRRNSLIGIGALQLIFLCTDKATAPGDRRDEDRALQLLVNGGRLDKTTANEIRQMVRTEASQSIAEIVLRDTPLSPVDWASAVSTARNKASLIGRILRMFGIGKK